MRTHVTSAVVAALVGSGAAILAAPGQTMRPGDMTRADVWVRNSDTELIPVRLRAAPNDPPVRVFVANGEGQMMPPLRVRLTAPLWEYRTVTVKAADDPANTLATLGADGWEVTGNEWPAPDGKKLLLKRAR